MVNEISGNLIDGSKIKSASRPRYYNAVYVLLLAVSLISLVVTALDVKSPSRYQTLFLLPLSFVLLLLINLKDFNKNFSNFGVMLIILLEFVRLVFAPLFLVWSNYYEVITINVASNTPKAINLMLYETLVIAVAIRLPVNIRKKCSLNKTEYRSGISRLHTLMVLYTAVLFVMCCIAPEVLLAHRTFLGAFIDKSYTSMTLDSVIALYPSGLKHYFLMLSRLLLTPYRLLLPAYLIIVLHHYFKKRFSWLAWLLSFFPFFMVNDVIAQSVYFTLFLLLLNCYLNKVSYKTIIGIFIAAAVLVVIYFCGRYLLWKSDGDSIVNDFAERFTTYFSGLNMVTGSFNQPVDINNKFQYFLYDFLKAIPFNKTLLGLDPSVSTAEFFHAANSIKGEIPTTIGMCYYYFGFVFAPLYSFVLARLAKRSGQKLINCDVPLLRVVYMFAAFILSLGIVMYNIEIACNTLVQLVLPIYIIAKISFRRKKSDT